MKPNEALPYLRRIALPTYWMLSVVPVAAILTSLGYTFACSLLLASMLLPGAMALRHSLPSIRQEGGGKGLKLFHASCVVAGVFVLELVLMLACHLYLRELADNLSHYLRLAPMLANPAFLGLVLTALACGHYRLGLWLERACGTTGGEVTFTSDYRRTTLRRSDILYVESRDTEVWLHTTEGGRYRNKTPISQWESLLGAPFVRIHRSFLVNADHITAYDHDTLSLGQARLPVSRKYKERIRRLAGTPGR